MAKELTKAAGELTKAAGEQLNPAAQAKEAIEVVGKGAEVWKGATRGTCCVSAPFRLNCTRDKDGTEAGVKKCSDCGYTFCDYHHRPGAAMSAGGHQCRPQDLECSVIGLARNNCFNGKAFGPSRQCPHCKFTYCEYHFRPASWYSMQGGHTCS